MRLIDPEYYEQIKSTGQLRSPDGLAWAVVELLQRDYYQVDDLIKLIRSDPVISEILLKFYNDTSCGQDHHVVSVAEAVAALGVSRTRFLVIVFSLLRDHRSGHCPQFDYGQFWSRSLATAIAAQALSSYGKISAGENFIAGLLCGIGELTLASFFPERYGEINSGVKDFHGRIALEHALFRTDHRELAVALLKEWGLQEVLVTAIYHHEAPEDAGFQEESRIFAQTMSLHIARALAAICVDGEDAALAMRPDMCDKADRLGISEEKFNAMAEGVVVNWLDWCGLLHIQTREWVCRI